MEIRRTRRLPGEIQTMTHDDAVSDSKPVCLPTLADPLDQADDDATDDLGPWRD